MTRSRIFERPVFTPDIPKIGFVAELAAKSFAFLGIEASYTIELPLDSFEFSIRDELDITLVTVSTIF